MGNNDDRGQVTLRFYLKPVHLNKTLTAIFATSTQGAAIGSMNNDSLVGIEKSHNGITGNRTATVPQFHHHRHVGPRFIVATRLILRGRVSIFARLLPP